MRISRYVVPTCEKLIRHFPDAVLKIDASLDGSHTIPVSAIGGVPVEAWIILGYEENTTFSREYAEYIISAVNFLKGKRQ